MGEHFKTNAAILENRGIPILAFTRVSNSDYFTFQGVFSYANHNAENDGARWFELVLRNSQPADIVTNAVYLEDDFVTSVNLALTDSRENRLGRLKAAAKKPKRIVCSSLNSIYSKRRRCCRSFATCRGALRKM